MSENLNDSADRGLEDGAGSASSDPVFGAIDADALDGADDVLVLGPMRGALDEDACSALMRTWPVTERNVLFVSLTQAADDRVALLRRSTAEMPEHVCVVSGADRYGSETTTSVGGRSSTLSVESVRDPSDLPRLGMTISKAIDEWEGGHAPLVCFHSLTALLQYTGTKRAFRFVHLLQNRLPGTAHYHMDADAHDGQTVATLRPLFDAVVEYDADGTVTVTD
jgi:hypothetical protein